jgi:outer membrane biosynthesis protein TonB
MSIPMRNPYEDPRSPNKRLVIDVFLLSVLAHALLFTLILLIAAFLPMPKIKVPAPPPTTTLTLEQAPAPPPKQIFIPTTPQANVPHKVQPVVSANDTELTSKSTVARNPDSFMPDVTGKPHADALNNAPQVTAPPKPEVSSTPPTPKADKPEKPTPPQPNPSQGKQPSPQPQPKPLPPTPPAPKPQTQLVDENGFPVLPQLNVPTMAPPNSAAQPLAPAPSQVQQAQSVHGSLGRNGANSPAAMATELGKYKQYVYQVVGTYWYPDIDQHFGTIGVGMVHIQFTIHSDGKMTDVHVLPDTSPNVMILQTISHNALIKPAPYKPFSDALIKEVGDSFTDDFTFSVY